MTDEPIIAPKAPGRDLPTATAVGVALAALFLVSLFWGRLPFTIVVSLLVVAGVWEAGTELGKVGLKVDPLAAIAGSLAPIWLAHTDGPSGQTTGLAVMFLLAVAAQFVDKERTDILRRLSVTVFLGMWVGFLASFAILLRAQPDGAIVALAVIGAAIFTDIGGYAVGARFGRTKIAPRISPNKSLEGLAGGLVLAMVMAAIVLPWASDLFGIGSAVAMALVVGFAGFVGDLAESMIKRDMGIKDFGALFPGHGGVLDRVDGILLALPLGYLAIDLLR